MPIDRFETLRSAETLIRQGRLEQAIGEYVRLVAEDPRDWNTVNALGDLYLRAGQPAEAMVEFARAADRLSTEGFLPKAAAIYRKILKVRPDDDHALSQAAEVAARQGLMADARVHLRALGDSRRGRGDEDGVAAVLARLTLLDADDSGPPAPDVTVLDAQSESFDVVRECGPTAVTAKIEAPRSPPPVEKDLDAVFAGFRDEASRNPRADEAGSACARGIALYAAGQIVEAIEPLETASRSPGFRFVAASTLGRIFLQRGGIGAAIEWFERAAETPAPTRDAGHRLLYELADALEAAGESARALAVCIELQAEAGDYGDVSARIDRLSGIQARG